MKTMVQFFCGLWVAGFCASQSKVVDADTNPLPRLTVELRDGSRVVGTSVENKLKFHSALLGDMKLAVEDIRSVECVSRNSAKLTTTGGDMLTVSFGDSDLAVKTSFGQVELGVDSVHKISLTTGGKLGSRREGLVALWSGEGNANDRVGGNNGFPRGALGYATGKTGQAFVFDNRTSYIRVPASPSLNIGAGEGFTIECWIKPNDYDVNVCGAPIIEWDSDTADGLQLWTGTTLMANLEDTSGNPHVFEVPLKFETDHFQQVALTYDRASGKAVLYYNGAEVASINCGNITPQTTYPVNIGRRTGQPIGLNDTYGGLLDELSLYNRALSDSEIRENYVADQNN